MASWVAHFLPLSERLPLGHPLLLPLVNPRVSSLHQQPKENYTLTSSLSTICIAKTLHPSSLPHTLAIYPAALESCMDG